jgi:tetratricopeptide (TPR) repeat protein
MITTDAPAVNTRAVTSGGDFPVTSGFVAVSNLQAQIDGLQSRASLGISAVKELVGLIELVTQRGVILGQIADYQWAEKQAERLVREFPAADIAFIARARARGTFHRFTEALADLEKAERLGAPRETVDGERAGLFQALGRYDEALALFGADVERRRDFTSLGALATLHAEMGEIARAEQLFSETRNNYRGVSPIPLALLDFRQGHMWMAQGDLPQSRVWFEESIRRLPGYVQAQGHLAEAEAEFGEFETAIRRLRPLTVSSDDPDYCSALDRVLRLAGRDKEAEPWRARAAVRYDELLRQHPAAFADHAASFWLEAGDPCRAHELALYNYALRQTPRAAALAARAAKACGAQTPLDFEQLQPEHLTGCKNRRNPNRH